MKCQPCARTSWNTDSQSFRVAAGRPVRWAYVHAHVFHDARCRPHVHTPIASWFIRMEDERAVVGGHLRPMLAFVMHRAPRRLHDLGRAAPNSVERKLQPSSRVCVQRCAISAPAGHSVLSAVHSLVTPATITVVSPRAIQS